MDGLHTLHQELVEFKKEVLVRNMELVKHETTTARDLANLIAGCMVLMETDTALSDRLDQISERIDIVNKRLRKIETALTQGVIICDNLGSKREN